MNSLPEVGAIRYLTELRIEQASLLKKRAFFSCLIVEFIASYTAAIILITGSTFDAILWFLCASAMVGITYAYARLVAPSGIDKSNFQSYLRGHVIISSLTGAIWGSFAIYQIDFGSEFSVFLACLMVISITLSGVLPGSIYRSSYIGLSVFSLPPLGLYLVTAAPNPFGLVGLGIMFYFLFAMFISARVEIETRETIAARHAQELADKVAAQNEMIQRASQEKTRFLAATGHDLAQPLHAQGFFMQALRPMLTTPDQLNMLGKIKDSWRAQSELSRGIVDISRIDSGAIVVHNTTVDLAREGEILAQEFLANPTKPLTLNCNFEDVRVETDSTLLVRIIRNILSNAQKYTPSNGTVDFTIRRSADLVQIIVHNSGPGISKEDQQRIFEEYVQLEGEGKKSGLGLGLSIVRRLADLLGIELALESSPNAGTSFTLSLPATDTADQTEPVFTPIFTGFQGTPLVVLVDDEDAIRHSMSAVFSSWNCQLITGRSSAEALDLVSRTTEIPSLLVIDKRLGNGENGLDLIQALRDEVNQVTPAILISGDLTDLERTKLLPDVQLMSKPVDPLEIRHVMEGLLNEKSLVK